MDVEKNFLFLISNELLEAGDYISETIDMKKNPPHLPPKTKDLIMKDTYRSISTVIFLVFIAFITSVAASLSTIAWIAPFSVTDTSYIPRSAQSLLDAAAEIDPVVEKQVRQRLMQVYDRRKKIQNEYYTDTASVGQAMMLTSEGWAVMHVSAYVRGSEVFWESVDHQGMIFSVETSFQDPVSGLVYLKIIGDGFRGDVSFPDWDSFDRTASLTALSTGGVSPAVLESLVRTRTTEQHPISEPVYAHHVAGDVAVGDVLIAHNGAFVGFINEEKELVESWLISTQLQPLFEKETNEYVGLPLVGYQVSGVVVEDMFESINGFFVTKAPTQATSSTIGVGDVVLGIQGVPYDEVTSARSILFAPDTLTVQLLRAGSRVDVQVEKSVLLR